MNFKKYKTKNYVAKLPLFSQAVIAGDFIYVSGILGTKLDKMEIVRGGVCAETEEVLFHINNILGECNATLSDIVKFNVFLTDMDNLHDMSSAYLDIIVWSPPALTVTGVNELAMGASVEMDCIAYLKR
ncbi:MAG: RidA family protein [Desulfobacula sp.]|nr:RidA family protein [Desulfobacula sp.]